MSRHVNRKIYQLYCALHSVIEAAVPTTMQKAVQMADDDAMIRRIKKHRYGACPQGTPGKKHAVSVTDSGIKCECPHGQKGRAACRHAKAVELVILRG